MKLASILGIRGARDKPRDSYGVRLIPFCLGGAVAGRS